MGEGWSRFPLTNELITNHSRYHVSKAQATVHVFLKGVINELERQDPNACNQKEKQWERKWSRAEDGYKLRAPAAQTEAAAPPAVLQATPAPQPSHSTHVLPLHSEPASSQAGLAQMTSACTLPTTGPFSTGPTRGTGLSFPSARLRDTRRPWGFGTHACLGPRHRNLQWLAPPTPPSTFPRSRLAPVGSLPHLAHLLLGLLPLGHTVLMLTPWNTL